VARRPAAENGCWRPGARQQAPAGCQQQGCWNQVENTNALSGGRCPVVLPQPQRGEISEAQSLYKRAGGWRRSVAAINATGWNPRPHPRAIATAASPFLEQHADQSRRPAGPGAGHRGAAWIAAARSAPRNGALRRRKAQRRPQPLELRTPRGHAGAGGPQPSPKDWISSSQGPRG